MTEYLAGKYAGGIASESLLPTEHIAANSGWDESDVSDVLDKCQISAEQKESLRTRAETDAKNIVLTQREAIASFTDALHAADECLDGPEAERIIMALIEQAKMGEG